MKSLIIFFLLISTRILCMECPLYSILKKNKPTSRVFKHADCVSNAVQTALITGDTKPLCAILERGACSQSVYNVQLAAVMEVECSWLQEGSAVPENVKKTMHVMKKFPPKKIQIHIS